MIDTVDMSEKLKLGLADILKPIEGYLKSVDEETATAYGYSGA